MTTSQRRAATSLRRPLCRRYALGIFDAALVRLDDAHGLQERRVHWAFGWLPDGECECLGAWMGAAQGLPRMLADLKQRGVMRIEAVASTADAERAHWGVAAELPDTIAYPFVGQLLVGAPVLSSARVPAAARLVARRIRGSLVRAVARHGSFASELAVLDFVAAALQRTERRLDRERSIAKGRPRLDPGARMVPTGI